MEREDIILSLERDFGVEGSMVYLLDVIPLVVLMWADGHNQANEIALVCDFIQQHRERLRDLAGRLEVVDDETERRFVERFVLHRPPRNMLSALWRLAHPLVFSSSDQRENQAHAQRILDFCMDVAAACVVSYPFQARERFLRQEKDALYELIKSLDIPADLDAGGSY